jgi:hypothetical protein
MIFDLQKIFTVKKSCKKTPNPILSEMRGFTYTHTSKAVSRKPVFQIFFRWAAICPFKNFPGAFLEAPRRAEKQVLFRLP